MRRDLFPAQIISGWDDDAHSGGGGAGAAARRQGTIISPVRYRAMPDSFSSLTAGHAWHQHIIFRPRHQAILLCLGGAIAVRPKSQRSQ